MLCLFSRNVFHWFSQHVRGLKARVLLFVSQGYCCCGCCFMCFVWCLYVLALVLCGVQLEVLHGLGLQEVSMRSFFGDASGCSYYSFLVFCSIKVILCVVFVEENLVSSRSDPIRKHRSFPRPRCFGSKMELAKATRNIG